MPRTPWTLIALVVIAVVSRTSTAGAPDWSQFRGAAGDGITSSGGLLSSPDLGLALEWKKTIGSGYSGVTVGAGRAVTQFSDGTSDVIAAFDAESGFELWRFKIGKTYKGHDGSHDGPIATPYVDGVRVIGLGAFGRMFSLDAATGKELWSVSLTGLGAPKPHYGFGTSPIVVDGVLVVQAGFKDGAIAGFDLETGKRLWASGEDGVMYQSPLPISFFGQRAVLGTGAKNLMWIEPKSGKLLHQAAHEGGGMGRGAPSLMPVPAGEHGFFVAYKDESSAMLAIGGTSAEPTVTRSWEDRSIRNSYNIPVYRDGHVYAFSSRFLTCVDAATGKSKWRSRQPGDGFGILVDDHLVIATKEGGVAVVEASATGYKEIAHIEVFDDLCWSTPAFAGDAIYVRSLNGIARVTVGKAAPPAVASVAPATPASSTFARFITSLESSADKSTAIDQYLSGIKSFPIVEGDDRVHFVFRGMGTDLAVAGDLFGARQEQPMKRVSGTDLFYYSAEVEPDARMNYVFIRDYKELVDPRNDRTTRTTLLGADMEWDLTGQGMDVSWFAMPKWRVPQHFDVTPKARGRLQSHTLTSDLAKSQTEDGVTIPLEHTIDVYVPAGYDDSATRFPVLYVHGGKGAKAHGMLMHTHDVLAGQRFKPVITVFINYEPFGPSAMTYAPLVVREIVPFVDKTYRTVASRDGRGSYGTGFAGYSALLCALMNADVFGMAASQSAFIMDSMMPPLQMALVHPKAKTVKLYVDWGKYDFRNPHEAWDLAESNRKLAALLKEKGIEFAGGEVHDGGDWPSWRNRVDQILESLFAL
jgi:enterochelin esterase-like enzyme/outer membrane protein assembly factor BamB